jgi:hypothetical protein
MAKKKEIDLGFLKNVISYDEVIELPSKGLFYTETMPNIKDGLLHIRRMTGNDEKILSGLNRLNFYNKWSTVIKNCTQEDFDPYELTLFDTFYLMYWLRSKTYGPKYQMNMTCPVCNTEQNHYVDISKFPITYLDEKVEEPFNVKIYDDGKGNVIEIRLKYPRLGDYIESGKRNHSELGKKGVRISESIYMAFLCTHEMSIPQSNGVEILNPEEHEKIIVDVYNQLPADSMLYIREIWDKYDHGIIDPIDIICDDCGEVFSQNPIFSSQFFRPDLPNERITDNE